MLNIDYKKLLDIDYIKILNDVLIISLLLYQIIPYAKVPNFILHMFKIKIIRVLLIGLLFFKGQNNPDTVIYISLWYIIIIGELSKQQFFENFANDLESDDIKKLNKERQAELKLLEKKLNLAKLSVKNNRINLDVSEKYADEVGYKNVKMGELMDDINDRLEKATEDKDEPMIKLLEKIQKSVIRMESLSGEKTETANNKVNDLKNTLNDSKSKLKEAENELKEFNKTIDNKDDEDKDDEDKDDEDKEKNKDKKKVKINESDNYDKLKKNANKRLADARLNNKLKEVALSYYLKEQLKIKAINKELETLSHNIKNASHSPEFKKIFKIIRDRKKESKELAIKSIDASKKQYFELKQKTEYLLNLAKLDFINLKKYETVGRTAPVINKEKEKVIEEYKNQFLNNLKTKKALDILKNYVDILKIKYSDYLESKRNIVRKLDDANKTKKNKVYIGTLESIKNSITETVEILQKEISLQKSELEKLTEQYNEEIKKIGMIYTDFKTRFKDKLKSDISLVEKESDDEEKSNSNKTNPNSRIPTDTDDVPSSD